MLSYAHKRALLIIALSLSAGLGLFWIAHNHLLEYPWTQSNTPFYLIAAVGIAAGVLWTFTFWRRLGFWVAFSGGVMLSMAGAGITGMLFLYLQFVNSTLDFREPRTVEAFVTDKWTERQVGRYNATIAFRISIETPSEDQTNRTITVKHSMWDAVNKGDRAKITIGQGLFWPYVSRVEKLPLANEY